MSRYRWIVFDADGTLFDYATAEFNALTRTFRHHGLSFNSTVHRAFSEVNRPLWVEFEKGVLTSQRLRVQRFEDLGRALEIEICASDFSAEYLQNLGEETALFQGAEAVVESLSSDFDLMLATNGFAEVQSSRFSLSSITKYFDGVVISDEIGVAKPDPAFFSEVFSKMGNPLKTEVLMVGDSLSSDIAGGAGFGIDTCWFNPSGNPNPSSEDPTYEIVDLKELFEIVGGSS